MYEAAREVLPGGHTRTVLTHPPFPLTFVRGEGATLTDADGHTYIDLLGDYTAGLLGHSERRVIDAVDDALNNNVSVGGIHPAEAELARLMCARFGLDRVRFTNSGTEANLMAITTAIQATGRTKIMVIDGGYHGGVLYFASGAAPWNAPYDFVLAAVQRPRRRRCRSSSSTPPTSPPCSSSRCSARRLHAGDARVPARHCSPRPAAPAPSASPTR